MSSIEALARELVAKLPLIMHQLDQVGLHATARKMHEVVQTSGFELAEVIGRYEDIPGGKGDRSWRRNCQ